MRLSKGKSGGGPTRSPVRSCRLRGTGDQLEIHDLKSAQADGFQFNVPGKDFPPRRTASVRISDASSATTSSDLAKMQTSLQARNRHDLKTSPEP